MKFAANIFLSILLVTMAGCTQKTQMSEEDKFIEDLLSQMTIDEKIGQMNQKAWGDWNDMARNGTVGSVLNILDPKEINEMQRCAVEESRLGIPILIARDVIHGYKTIMPIPLGQAATFNPELVKKAARVAATEASSTGIRWTFAPMVDISRDARWGRIAESFGEDSYLSSVLGIAMVEGFQGDKLNDPTSIAACVKHFVGYGAAEGGRDYNSTHLTENNLRNVYLKPFEAACKAGAATYMTSFNDNDGVPCTANEFILKSVLRNEWGFDGLVVSDWGSVGEMITHGFVHDFKEAAKRSVNAGLDMEMVTGSFIKHGKELLDEKEIDIESINNSVRNILRVKYRLGLFDNPYVSETKDIHYADSHLETAKQTAIEGAILLKNTENTLPINKNNIKTIAIVGPMADAPYDQMGTWSFDGEKEYTVTPLKAIRELVGKDVNIIYEPGVTYSRDKNTSNINKAVIAAKKADVTLVFTGEEAILSGEAHSLADLNLQGAQKELVNALSSVTKNLVMVVMAGRPLTIGDEVEKCKSVLYSFHPGTMGGPALADLLFGNAVPSGKTPVTFPKTVGQIPIYYNHNMTGRPAQRNETLIDYIPLEAGQTSLGCTSFYLDAGFDPLFPFGYGLSYTKFEYDDPKTDALSYGKKDTIRVSCMIKNAGEYDADEIPQLYVRDVVGSITRPVKELKGFHRIHLKKGETKEVVFNLPVEELAFWNSDMKYEVESGEFHIWVSNSSINCEPVSIRVN